ncbi:MAG TPA: hypothetical protein VIT43_13845 [Candidatus Dormibacteraeota bacterium]
MARISKVLRCGTQIALVATVLSLVGPMPGALASDRTNRLSDLQAGELAGIVEKYPDVYAGLWGDPTTDVLYVSFAAGTVDASRRARARSEQRIVGTSNDPLRISRPKMWLVQSAADGVSLATLNREMASIATAEPWISDVKQDLVGWGIDPQRHTIRIGLTSVSGVAQRDAAKAFHGMATLVKQPRAQAQSRYLDSQPYYGSDHLTDSPGNPCTSGFAAYDTSNSSHRGFLTAGHCYPSGTVVLQGYKDSGGLHYSGNLGKVNRRSFSTDAADAEFMDATTVGTSISDFVWRGPNPPTGVTKPSGTGTSFVGLTVCFDGSVTAENCHAVVQATNQCQVIGGNTDCYLEYVTSSNGSILGQYGDSGGPVFKDDGFGGLTAYGLITGGTGTTEYYTDITAALNAMGGVQLIFN